MSGGVVRWGLWLAMACALIVVAAPFSPAEASSHDTTFVDIDLAASESGLWLTRADGTVETRGPAPHFGDRPALGSGEHVVALAPTPDGDGYWLFTNRGNVFAFGAADDHGDVGHLPLAGDIVAAVATVDGGGYYLIGSDGGIFTLGNAVYHGSIPEVLPGVTLDAPVVAISATPGGYVLVAGDGGTFAFGAAAFHGSIPGILPGVTLASPIVGLVPGPAGYLMLGGDGGIFNFGTSEFHGSLSGVSAAQVAAVAVRSDLSGYVIVDDTGTTWPLGDTRDIGVQTATGTGIGSVSYSAVEPMIVRIQSDTTSAVEVHARDGAGTTVDSMLVPSGPVDAEFYVHGPTVARLDVVATGSWTVRIMPVSHAKQWRSDLGGMSGSQPAVVRLTRPSPGSALRTTIASGPDAILTTHEPRGSNARLLFNGATGFPSIAPVLPTWDGPSVLSIRASSAWTLAVEPLALPRRVDVTGDSVAITMEINFPDSMAGTFTVRDSAIEGCGVIDEGSMISGGVIRRGFSVCGNFANRWAASVASHQADITVVVLGAWEVFDLWHLGRIIPFGSAEHDDILLAGIREGVDALLATGTEVALLEVPCQYPRAGGGLTPLPERGEQWRSQHLSDLLRAEASAHSQVHFLTTPPEFCTDISVGDNPGLRWDGTHYGPAGGAYVWNHLRDQLLGLP